MQNTLLALHLNFLSGDDHQFDVFDHVILAWV